MKAVATVIICLIANTLFAQTTRITRAGESSALKEQYYVLKSNKQFREGGYVLLSVYGHNKLCEGAYKNNLKDGLWQYYASNGKLIDSGRYLQDKKIGVWCAYSYKSELLSQYDYTNRKLLFYKSDAREQHKMHRVINGADTISTLLDQPPIYLEGQGRMTVSVVYNVRYPQAAKLSRTQGKVIVGIIVNQDGQISDYRIKKSIGNGCDEEAIRVIKNIKGDWLPGVLNGKPITTELDMPVTFVFGD